MLFYREEVARFWENGDFVGFLLLHAFQIASKDMRNRENMLKSSVLLFPGINSKLRNFCKFSESSKFLKYIPEFSATFAISGFFVRSDKLFDQFDDFSVKFDDL